MKFSNCLRAILVSSVLSSTVVAQDWPFWRGPGQNDHSGSTGLVETFDPVGGDGSSVLWFNPDAGGISTPVVMNGRLFTILRHEPGTKREAEKVVALDAATGRFLWENVYNVFLTDFPAERIGWSNVTGDPQTGQVYALGSCSLFQCIEAATGKTVWSRSLSEQFGMLSTYGGRTNTPVVFENLVIISGVTTGWDSTARPSHRFFAFDKRDGRLVWTCETRPFPEDTTFSTPVIKPMNGKMVMVAGAGDGDVYGIEPRTGKLLWSHRISRRGINTSASIASDGTVFIGHGEENPEGTAMGAVVAIDPIAAAENPAHAELWRALEVVNGKSSPLLIEDDSLGSRIYVIEDSSKLRILNAINGEEIGRPIKLGTAMRGTPLYADGKIYLATSTGIVHVLRPTAEGVSTVFKLRLPKGNDVGGSMIAAYNCLFLPTTKGLFCLGNNAHAKTDGAASLHSALAFEEHGPGTAHPRSLQLVPCEAFVSPGQRLQLDVRGFDDWGERATIKTEIQYEVTGPAAIENGVLIVNDDATHSVVTVTARCGKAAGSARFRVVPPMPWKFDFADGDVPVTWIGARYRHEGRTVDGEPVLVKVSTIPKGTRSQSWFGPSDLSQYTVQADFRVPEGTDKLPDMGLIGQRYTLDLMGESQQLQIRTWTAQLRMAQSEPVRWKAGVWYTLKLQTSVDGATAVLRGKVWPRDEEEPSGWTVTATDESPNLSGSPGLFGNATNAEIFIDNVQVTK